MRRASQQCISAVIAIVVIALLAGIAPGAQADRPRGEQRSRTQSRESYRKARLKDSLLPAVASRKQASRRYSTCYDRRGHRQAQ